MKLQWSFLVGILMGLACLENSDAAGFRCESECIVIDPGRSQLHLLGTVEYSADLSRGEVFRTIRRNCHLRAKEYGNVGVLIESLWFRSARRVRHSSSVEVEYLPAKEQSVCHYDSAIPVDHVPHPGGSESTFGRSSRSE